MQCVWSAVAPAAFAVVVAAAAVAVAVAGCPLQLQLLSLSVHKSCEISHFAHFRFVLTSVTYAHMKNNRLQQAFICLFAGECGLCLICLTVLQMISTYWIFIPFSPILFQRLAAHRLFQFL